MLASVFMALAIAATDVPQPVHLCGIDHVAKTSDGTEITFTVGFHGGIMVEQQNAAQSVLQRYAAANGKVRTYIMPTPNTMRYEGPILEGVPVPDGAAADIASGQGNTCEAKSVQKDGRTGIALDLMTDTILNGKDVTEERTEFIPD